MNEIGRNPELAHTELLRKFRELWVEPGADRLDLEFHVSQLRMQSRSFEGDFTVDFLGQQDAPFDPMVRQMVGMLALPIGETRTRFTLGFDVLTLPNHERLRPLVSVFRQLAAQAGSLLGAETREMLRPFISHADRSPAAWWYALLFAMSGETLEANSSPRVSPVVEKSVDAFERLLAAMGRKDVTPIPETPTGAGNDGGGENTNDGDGKTWEDVAKRLEALKESGRTFQNVNQLVKAIGCGRTTYYKIIKHRPELAFSARRKKASPPKAVRLTDVLTDSKAQEREPNPADMTTYDEAQIILRRLIEEAPPARRPELHELSKLPPDELRRVMAPYAGADDLGNRVLGRCP